MRENVCTPVEYCLTMVMSFENVETKRARF